MKRDSDRLRDIIEAISKIEKYSADGREPFDADELIQTWMIHHLQIIGEAAGRLAQSFREKHPTIAWKEITAMRNIIVHDYSVVDMEEVWGTVVKDLPELKRKISDILLDIHD